MRPAAGLCGRCVHVKEIRSRKGSVFLLCTRSWTDSRFPRYPLLPVLSCPGWEPGVGVDGAGDAEEHDTAREEDQ